MLLQRSEQRAVGKVIGAVIAQMGRHNGVNQSSTVNKYIMIEGVGCLKAGGKGRHDEPLAQSKGVRINPDNSLRDNHRGEPAALVKGTVTKVPAEGSQR